MLDGRRLAVIHGGVTQIKRFLFASTPVADKLSELHRLDADIERGVITGHRYRPFGHIVEGKAWLNAGVIGMLANDDTKDSWYLLV